MKAFSIIDSVTCGWKMMKENLGFLIVTELIIIGVQIFLYVVIMMLDMIVPFGSINLRIVLSFSSMLITIGIANVSLKLYDNKKVEYLDIFNVISFFLSYFLSSILYGIISGIGFLIFIIIILILFAFHFTTDPKLLFGLMPL